MMFDKIKKDKFLLGLVGVVFFVLVIRLWQIDNLFTFKMDQARDIKLVEEAYDNGVGELPLLGPRAAKTYLRLGPIFYYFEYLAMWLTGNKSPLGVVWLDLIFSILTIPLFYYFLRQAFNKKNSFLTTVVLASSFFLNQYGRFAWNPNSIPFWSLLFFLGVYKIVTMSIMSKVYNVDLIWRNVRKRLERCCKKRMLIPAPCASFLHLLKMSSSLMFEIDDIHLLTYYD